MGSSQKKLEVVFALPFNYQAGQILSLTFFGHKHCSKIVNILVLALKQPRRPPDVLKQPWRPPDVPKQPWRPPESHEQQPQCTPASSGNKIQNYRTEAQTFFEPFLSDWLRLRLSRSGGWGGLPPLFGGQFPKILCLMSVRLSMCPDQSSSF